jgi:hypothetical protein
VTLPHPGRGAALTSPTVRVVINSVSELVGSRLLGLTVRQLVVPPVWLGLERVPPSAQFEGLQFETPFQLAMDSNLYDIDPKALE